ncbi:hypothetical protein [Tistrella mobilis]|uniref:hypothetical protein n=1 Tax=Tistrella mobilis TaxID=171437 RepID=UPI00355679F0
MAKPEAEALTGGQWNLSGVLYQLLTSLKSGLSAVVQEVNAEGDVASVRLVIEPAKGGDVQIHQAGLRCVDQIKIRRGVSPWTTNIIIKNVLPDLFKAVGDGNTPSKFRFFTDNVQGAEHFSRFLESVRALDAQGKGPQDLDIEESPSRGRMRSLSHQEIYAKIAGELNAAEPALWKFLAATEVVGWDEATVENDIDKILAELVAERAEVLVKRRALTQRLLELGAAGKSISAERLLQDMDLDPSRLVHAQKLRSDLYEGVKHALQQLRYDQSMDVRTAPNIPDAPFSVLSGDSGQGKTWRLCAAALASVEANRCALLLHPIGSLADLEREIVNVVWRRYFDRDLPLSVIADRLAPRLRGDDEVWLTVFLDDLADPDLATALAKSSWDRLGIRLVISAQDRITRLLSNHVDDLYEIQVPDFTLAELHDYLRRSDRDPSRLPDDVLLSLTRPILADIYCRIPCSENWRAVSEYELMQRYWDWATKEYRTQSLHRTDAHAVLGLAGTLLDDRVIYPWTPTVTNRMKLTDEARGRLIAVGILREDTDGGLQVSHDRILNWIVALEIQRRFLEGELDVQGLADLIGRLDDISTLRGERIGQRLGYVMLDLFWRLIGQVEVDELAEIILLTIHSNRRIQNRKKFFVHGLGTLGVSFVPVLKRGACRPSSEVGDWAPQCLADTFIAIATAAKAEVAAAAYALVKDDIGLSRNIGLMVLSVVPAPEAVDLLWSINHERHKSLITAEGTESWPYKRADHEQSFKALSCAVRSVPHWLQEKALSKIDAEDAEQLIWLLMRLDIHTAKPIWGATKTHLLNTMPIRAPVISRALRYFRDYDQVERIEAALEEPEPFVAGFWFDALVYLAPKIALEYIGRLTAHDISGTSDRWLPVLLRRAGNVVSVRLVEAASQQKERDQREIQDLIELYAGDQDLIDPFISEFLIEKFEELLVREERGEKLQPGVLRSFAELISSTTSPVLLQCLAGRQGSSFETAVRRKAMQRREWKPQDSEGDAYRFILAAIGDEGYSRLVLTELEQSDIYDLLAVTKAARWTHHPVVKARLEAVARQPVGDRRLQRCLMRTLSSHHADEAIIAMVRNGSEVEREIFPVREGDFPWNDAHIRQIEALVESDILEERFQGIKLCSFLGKEKGGRIVAPVIKADPATSEGFALALSVVRYLGYYQPDFLTRCRALMTYDEAGAVAARYLVARGDAEARNAVVKWLAAHPLAGLTSLDLPVAFRLLDDVDSAPGARAFLKRVWKRGLGFGSEGQILGVLADAGDEEATAALPDVAYREPLWDPTSAVAAIKALRDMSPADAWVAAERLYHRRLVEPVAGRLSRAARAKAAARLLLDLDARRGSEILLKDFPAASVSLRHDIGRLLRQAAPRAWFTGILTELSRSEATADRLTAAELAGWLPFEEPIYFLDYLAEDEAEVVERAAVAALRQREADAGCATLIKRLADQPRPRQWAWLHALVRLGDPAHFANPEDPRSLHALIDQLGEDFREEVNGLLKKRVDELKTHAEMLEGRQHR